MHASLTNIAEMLQVSPVRVDRELHRAIRRTEPDARGVYGVIDGYRMVGRRGVNREWVISLEAHGEPWEGHA